MENKPCGALRAMRAAASPLDLDAEALRPAPAKPYYVPPPDTTGLAPREIARDLGALMAWCEANDHDAAGAVGRALRQAMLDWVRPISRRTANRLMEASLGDTLWRETHIHWQSEGEQWLGDACQHEQARLIRSRREMGEHLA